VAKWADWLLAVWTLFVAVVYVGGCAGVFAAQVNGAISPWIAMHTADILSAVYALMIIISLTCAVFGLIRPATGKK
jgi:succinate dehydrogenase hydrophobic anchor subunit